MKGSQRACNRESKAEVREQPPWSVYGASGGAEAVFPRRLRRLYGFRDRLVGEIDSELERVRGYLIGETDPDFRIGYEQTISDLQSERETLRRIL